MTCGGPPPPLRPLQQAGHPARLERTDPVEELTTAATHLLGNLRGGDLTATGQTHGQEPLLGFDVFAGAQRLGDSLG